MVLPKVRLQVNSIDYLCAANFCYNLALPLPWRPLPICLHNQHKEACHEYGIQVYEYMFSNCTHCMHAWFSHSCVTECVHCNNWQNFRKGMWEVTTLQYYCSTQNCHSSLVVMIWSMFIQVRIYVTTYTYSTSYWIFFQVSSRIKAYILRFTARRKSDM